MLLKIDKFLKIYGIYILIVVCFILGLLSLKFQNTVLDDDLYLFETNIITHCIKNLQWYGRYAVGVHGSLFKLPVALIFLLTGPSLTLATIYNIILACMTLYVFYTVLNKIFPKTIFPLLGTVLFFTTFQFILNYVTYMREIPAVLSFLLLINAVYEKKSYWIIGLLLLLVMEAKELVFFMIAPGFVVGVLINEWSGLNLKSIWKYVQTYFKLFLPILSYLLLMLFTSIIPLNTVIFTVIPGITEGGVEYQLKHFEKKAATQSIVRLQNPEAATIQDIVQPKQNVLDEGVKAKPSLKWITQIWSTAISYIGKIFYPRTFSFLSVPKIIFFPSLLTSFVLFKEFLFKKKYFFILLSLILWSFISVYILRQSFDRYMFPIIPIIIIFFLKYLLSVSRKRKVYISIFAISSLFAILGIIFEAEYIWIKLLLNGILIVILALYLFIPKQKKYDILRFLAVTFIGGVTFAVSIFYYYASGQLHRYLQFGNDYEVAKVVKYFRNGEKILINDPGWDLLIGTYRGNRAYSPEWKWALRSWVPRKKHLKIFDEVDTYTISGEERNMVEVYGIEKIGLIVSTLQSIKFPYQERLEEYMNADWLKLEKKIELKNKQLYIFEVINTDRKVY